MTAVVHLGVARREYSAVISGLSVALSVSWIPHPRKFTCVHSSIPLCPFHCRDMPQISYSFYRICFLKVHSTVTAPRSQFIFRVCLQVCNLCQALPPNTHSIVRIQLQVPNPMSEYVFRYGVFVRICLPLPNHCQDMLPIPKSIFKICPQMGNSDQDAYPQIVIPLSGYVPKSTFMTTFKIHYENMPPKAASIMRTHYLDKVMRETCYFSWDEVQKVNTAQWGTMRTSSTKSDKFWSK